jgi:hypothetical protein
MSRGNAPEEKTARRRRLISTAKAQGHKLEIALDRARLAAARAIAPNPESVADDGAHYVVKTYVHRQTGSRIRILDTEAADSPRDGLLPATDGAGRVLRYAVECLDHDSEPQYVETFKAATKAVRNSATWCDGCAPVSAMRPKVSARAKQTAKAEDARTEGRVTPGTRV